MVSRKHGNTKPIGRCDVTAMTKELGATPWKTINRLTDTHILNTWRVENFMQMLKSPSPRGHSSYWMEENVTCSRSMLIPWILSAQQAHFVTAKLSSLV